MKKPVVSLLLVSIISFTLTRLMGNADYLASTPSLQQLENRIRTWKSQYQIVSTTNFGPGKMKEIFGFQSPSISHLSIPYLTLLAIQLEAKGLKGPRQ